MRRESSDHNHRVNQINHQLIHPIRRHPHQAVKQNEAIRVKIRNHLRKKKVVIHFVVTELK